MAAWPRCGIRYHCMRSYSVSFAKISNEIHRGHELSKVPEGGYTPPTQSRCKKSETESGPGFVSLSDYALVTRTVLVLRISDFSVATQGEV